MTYPKQGSRQIYVHRIIAEKALGHSLPLNAEVHHHGGNIQDPTKNLVICQDRAYHMLLEQRTRAFNACGRADALFCRYCKEYDQNANLFVFYRSGGTSARFRVVYHPACHAKANRLWKRKQKLQAA